ncbi:ankyrin repeat-containing domain protein [Aspergillus crustosus]
MTALIQLVIKYDLDDEALLDCVVLQTYLLEKEKDVLSADTTQQRVELIKAILTTNVDEVEAKLADIPADDLDATLQTALHAASLAESAELTKLFLDRGASPKPTTPHQCTALHHASFSGDFGIVKLLLDSGADPYARDADGSIPLNIAIGRGLETVETTKYLIQHHGFGREYTSTTPALITAWGTMAGTITGSYTHTSWRKGVEEETSFEVIPWADEEEETSVGKAPTFIGAGRDGVSPFEVYGSLYGENQVVWVKLYGGSNGGWLYSGTVDLDTKTIAGSWGTNPQLWYGTFKLKCET